MNTPVRSIASACCVVLFGVASLSACGSDDDASDADLAKALLVADDLSNDFRISDDDDDDDSDDASWGCLLDFADDLEEQAGSDKDDSDDIEISLEAAIEPGMPAVMEEIGRVDSVDEARDGLTKIADLVGKCHSVDSTDDDGANWKFTVDSDRVAWADGVDQQVNVLAAGSVSTQGLELPVALSFSVVRIEDVVTMVMFLDMAEDIDAARRDVVNVAVERLHAALAGDDQPDPAGVLEDYPVGAAYADLMGGADA